MPLHQPQTQPSSPKCIYDNIYYIVHFWCIHYIYHVHILFIICILYLYVIFQLYFVTFVMKFNFFSPL